MARLLVADDDQLIRSFLVHALALGGHECVTAADGSGAIALLDASSSFDCVVTDYSMPGATGIEVIQHALRSDPLLPCIIVTAFRDLDLAMRGMSAGAVGYIPKPFKAEHLLTVVERALERKHLACESMRLRLLMPMVERFTAVLANTLESKDCATQEHAERLVAHADAIGMRLGLDEDARFSLRLGACLHDIGKVGIPEHLLRKPTRLSAEEFATVRLHSEIGAAILEDVDTWEDVRLIVRHHHEHYNGAGYPLGLQGMSIPLGARIVNVVDAFDVMRAGRPYSPPRPLDQVVEELCACRGIQFDPDVVDVFLPLLEGTADYHGVVDVDAELDLVARRALTGLRGRVSTLDRGAGGRA